MILPIFYKYNFEPKKGDYKPFFARLLDRSVRFVSNSILVLQSMTVFITTVFIAMTVFMTTFWHSENAIKSVPQEIQIFYG